MNNSFVGVESLTKQMWVKEQSPGGVVSIDLVGSEFRETKLIWIPA